MEVWPKMIRSSSPSHQSPDRQLMKYAELSLTQGRWGCLSWCSRWVTSQLLYWNRAKLNLITIHSPTLRSIQNMARESCRRQQAALRCSEDMGTIQLVQSNRWRRTRKQQMCTVNRNWEDTSCSVAVKTVTRPAWTQMEVVKCRGRTWSRIVYCLTNRNKWLRLPSTMGMSSRHRM